MDGCAFAVNSIMILQPQRAVNHIPPKIMGTVLCVIDTENTHANNDTDREWKGVYKGGAIWYNKKDREREGRFDA